MTRSTPCPFTGEEPMRPATASATDTLCLVLITASLATSIIACALVLFPIPALL